MEKLISEYLKSIRLGELQQFEKMAYVPLSAPNGSPEYLTMKVALEKGHLTVTELSHSGSVPELRVVNSGDLPVLLLDGEEVAGAKQNRVLNTTILLKEKSETVIPVSCTEQGRWRYVSTEFADSKTVLLPKMRSAKTASVTQSLKMRGEYDSDQSEVWHGVAECCLAAGVHSPTSAMKDVFESRAHDLDEYLKAFECVPHQTGLLVLVNGEVVGLDILSLESAYEVLHGRLVKSYAMDALLEKARKRPQPSLKKAKEFLAEAALCEERKHQSIGLGWDYRFEGKGVVGSALVHADTVIHGAFFRVAGTDSTGPVTGYARRRDFRIEGHLDDDFPAP